MKRGERGEGAPIEEHSRPIKFLRVATGFLLAANIVSLGFMYKKDDKPLKPYKAAVATSIMPVPTTLQPKPLFSAVEQAPATTVTTLLQKTHTLIPNTTLIPTTTTSLPEHTAVLSGNRSAPTHAQSVDRDQRCQNAIATANVEPAPNYFIICGPDDQYNSPTDGDVCPYIAPDAETDPQTDHFYECQQDVSGGEIRIHPDDWDSDAEWAYTVKHEVGHSYCVSQAQPDYTEWCADHWAHTH